MRGRSQERFQEKPGEVLGEAVRSLERWETCVGEARKSAARSWERFQEKQRGGRRALEKPGEMP